MTTMPILTWLPGYRREWLRADIVAGLTTAALVIPRAMAIAVIAGLPVQAGLYTALAAMLVYPLLGSSRPLSVSSTTAIAMLTAAAVVSTASQAVGADVSSMAATLALLVGGIMIVARLLRLGFVADFISIPVQTGFQAGVGVVVVVGQLKSVLGVDITSQTTIGTLMELPGVLTGIHFPTLVVATAGFVILLAVPRALPRVPVSLVWVVLSILAAAILSLEALGVRSIGAIPAGLPLPKLPDLTLAGLLWPAALGIALMSFTESVASARAFADRNDAPVDANRELLAIGAANLASCLAGGMPAGGGASQTAVADAAGARSQMAQWVNAAAMLITLLLLAGVIELLPQAALGTLVLVAGLGMIKPNDFRAIANVRYVEWVWALVTLAGVVLVGILEGILIAVAISVLTLLYQANRPAVYAVAYNRAKDFFQRSDQSEVEEATPGLLMLRTEGRLTFANAADVGDKMRVLVQAAQPRLIALECSAIPDIEYTALMMLTEAEKNLRQHGVALWLVAVNPDLRKVIDRSPLGAALGQDRIFPNLYKALDAWRQVAESQKQPKG